MEILTFGGQMLKRGETKMVAGDLKILVVYSNEHIDIFRPIKKEGAKLADKYFDC
jgi:hypothetical protein